VNTIKFENPRRCWTPGVQREITELFRKAVELEYAYARYDASRVLVLG